MTKDEEHLRLLSTLHYVVAGLVFVFALFPIFPLLIGIGLLSGSIGPSRPGALPGMVFAWYFVLFESLAITIGTTLAALLIMSGRRLQQRQSRGFCMIVAGISCAMMPFGTALGVFTLVVLNRDSVRRLFENSTEPGS